MKKKNVILIQTDQQTAGTLGIYGNPIVKTPTIEKLANEGMVFEEAFCNYPACAPSRSAMMTGRYTSTIRNHANHMLLNPAEVTMPKVFKDNGYKTALIGKNHAFLTGENYYSNTNRSQVSCNELQANFDYIFEGHHVWVDDMEKDKELFKSIKWAEENVWQKQHNFQTNPYPCEKSVTYVLSDNAIEYITENKESDNPFFLWLSYPDPHTPYQVSEPYASMYNPDDVPEPIFDDLENKPERQKIAHYLDYNHQYNSEHFKRLRALYYGMINQIDDNLNRVIKTLEEKNMLEDTIIVFLSDHGDALGDHGIIQKHNFFYDSFVHVPFIISWKGHIRNGRTENIAELVDVMPTLLDLCNIEIPNGVQGKSIAPFLKGENYEPKEYAVIESGENIPALKLNEIFDDEKQLVDKATDFAWCAYREAWAGKCKAIRTNDWKLCIYSTGEGELYDLKNNPDETINLYKNSKYQNKKNELVLKLLLWCFENEDTLPLNKTVDLNFR